MAYIELKNIRKSYDGKKDIVKDINFEIEENEFIVLLGPSGCGKTTILRMIAGLEEITSGELYIKNKLSNEIEPKNRNIGMVFQNYALYPHLSVFENIAFPLKIKKINKAKINEKVQQTAELIELQDYLQNKPKELSGGQRQRVALGRAIIKEPDVFLFDEPLSNLDAKLRVQMRNEIVKIQRKIGKPAIYVTHDQIEAMTMGDRIIILNDGIIQQNDTPENIYQNPKNLFVASFIGSPQINIFKNGELIKNENYKSHCIRPEKLYFKKIGDNLSSLKAELIRYEFIGNEYFIYFHIGNNEIKTLRSPINPEKYINKDKIEIFYNPSDLIMF